MKRLNSKRVIMEISVFHLLVVLISMSFLFAANASAKNMFTRLYVRRTCNPRKSERVIEDMAKIRNWGLNGILVDHADWGNDQNFSTESLNGLKAIVAKADELGVGLIPMYPGQKHPSDINPDWGEAYPTKGTKYRVSGNKAILIGDPVALTNGNFSGGVSGWGGTQASSYDATTGKSSPGALRFAGAGGTRVSQTIKLKKFTTYLASAYIKTQGVVEPRDIGFQIASGGFRLRNLRIPKGVQKTQTWKLHKESFNSITCESALLTLRGANTGTVWFDDVEVREVGLYETVRRGSTPLVVKSTSGKVYVEGKDYVIQNASPVKPNRQASIAIPAGSSIGNGETILVDWYKWATSVTIPPQGSYSLEDVYPAVQKKVDALDAAFSSPRSWVLKYSEWRIACWDPTCQSKFKSSGEYFANTLQRSSQVLLKNNPKREILFYNDEFEPYHHVVHSLGHLRWGGTKGAWKGLVDNMIILNWNAAKPPNSKQKSMFFFAGMDPDYPEKKTKQRMIFGTDAGKNPNGSYNWWSGWLSELDKAEKAGLPDDIVIGISHLNYHTGVFDAAENMAKTCRAKGRWDGKFRRHDQLPVYEVKIDGPGVNSAQPKMAIRSVTLSAKKRRNGSVISYEIPQDGNVEMTILRFPLAGITACNLQLERIGYLAAHCLLGDLPVKRDKRGVVECPPRIVDRGSVGRVRNQQGQNKYSVFGKRLNTES